MTLWALHIADGVLAPGWNLAGFIVAGIFALWAMFKVREEDIPRIALLAAAFFVVSLIHIRIGPTSAHLLLSGLLGVILGPQVVLAIPVALALQVILIAHGGYLTLGVNTCILAIPALVVAGIYRQLHRMTWLQNTSARLTLICVSTMFWLSGLIFTVALLVTNPVRSSQPLQLDSALQTLLHPASMVGILTITLVILWFNRRTETSAEYALGLFLGIVAVLLSAFLNGLILLLGGVTTWNVLAVAIVIVHLPIAVLEGVIVGFTVSFLQKVKPELLGSLDRTTPTNSESAIIVTGDSACSTASSSS